MIHPVQLKKSKKLATLVAVFGLSLAVAGCGVNAPATPTPPVAPATASTETAPTSAPQTEPASVATSTPTPTSTPTLSSTSTPVPVVPAPTVKPELKQPAKENTPTPAPAPAPAPTPTPAPAAPTPASAYKDGTYSATGNYGSPAGAETIGVTITLKSDVIADAVVEAHATNPRSKIMQADFVANYKPLVIGKKIDEVRLTKVSGSSLTSTGFNEALAKIKAQAK